MLLFPPQAGLKQLEFSATKLRNECLAFIHIVFLFKVRAIMLLSTQSSDEINSNCFKPGLRGKSSTIWKWHCLRIIALYRIKTPYPYLMNLVSNYLENNILSNTVKNQWYSIKNVVDIPDQNRCILFGPPRIAREAKGSVRKGPARPPSSLDTGTLPRQVFAGDILPSGIPNIQKNHSIFTEIRWSHNCHRFHIKKDIGGKRNLKKLCNGSSKEKFSKF